MLCRAILCSSVIRGADGTFTGSLDLHGQLPPGLKVVDVLLHKTLAFRKCEIIGFYQQRISEQLLSRNCNERNA